MFKIINLWIYLQLPGIAALVYAISSSKKAKETISDLKEKIH